MQIWNSDSNIADDMVRIVKFEFATDKGPGSVTTMINRGVSISSAKEQLLQEIIAMGGNYEHIEITSYEILEIVSDEDDDSNLGPLH